MGKYQEINGDLLAMAKEYKFDVIAHGCNTMKSMGAGIALQIKRHFPDVYQKDYQDIRTPTQRWGDYTSVTYSNGKKVLSVFNLYTQYSPGPDLDYTALELSLKKLAKHIKPNSKIGLPQIGCGIGGGNWLIVKEIIQRVLSDYNVTIVIYDPEVGF
jgi:O-acetyl-ADP-ribose deacetylase (regulator of RNase III)